MCISSTAQSYFIKRYEIPESENAIFKGVISTDSAYWVMSNESDTFPPYNMGTGFYKINLNGDIEHKYLLKSKTKDYAFCDNLIAINNMLYTLALEPYDSNRLITYDILQDRAFEIITTGNKTKDGNFLSANTLHISTGGEFLIANTVSSSTDDYGQIQLEKFDGNHKIIFSKIFGKSSLTDVPYSLKTDEQGNIYVGCVRFKRNYSPLDNSFSRSVIYKLDSNGQIQKETIADSLSGAIYDFVIDSDGNYICASEVLLPYRNDRPFAYPAILKIEPEGHIIWRKYFEEIKKESLHQIFSKIRITKSNNGYVSIGGIEVDDDDINFGATETRALFIKLSKDGDIIWKRIFKTAFGVESTDMYDMDLTFDGGYVFTGLGAIGDLSGLSWKTILIKVDSFGCLVPGCQLTDKTNSFAKTIYFKMYPNPTHNYLAVYNITNHKLVINLFDANGKKLSNFKCLSNETSIIDISKYPVGSYLLQAIDNEKTICSEIFMKQ